MKIYSLIFLSFLLIALNACGQTDTTDGGVDTVYIKGDPVVIKSEFYLPETYSRDSAKWLIAAGFGAGKNFASLNGNNFEINSRGFFNYFIEAGRKYKQWTFTAGLGYLGSQGSLHYHSKYNFDWHEQTTKTDTIDVYDQIVQGISTRYYVTERKDTMIKHQEVKDTTLHYSYKQNYLLIPLKITHILSKEKWFISSGIGIAPSISLIRNSIIASNDKLKPRPFLFLGTAHAEVGRLFFDKISMSIYAQCYKNLSPVFNEARQPSLLLMTGGFKINFYL